MRTLTALCIIAFVALSGTTANGQSSADILSTMSDSMPLHMHGVAIPHEYVTMSPIVSGVMSNLRIEEGSRVKQGDMLGIIDDRVARASAAVARIKAESMAIVRQTQLDAKVAQSQMNRTAEVVHRGAGSSFELEEAQAVYHQAVAAYESAKEARAQAQEELKLAEAQLEQHYVRAPFDGKVTRIHVKVGESLAPQDKLITICNLATLEVELWVPANVYRGLKPGQDYQLRADAPLSKNVMATLQSVSPMIDTTMGAVRCLFIIDNSDESLPGGFSVTLHDNELRKLANSAKERQATPNSLARGE
ncbi:MAG: efflux RND transporter periplasmic adaptor subunit [Planctomycetota bacterium]